MNKLEKVREALLNAKKKTAGFCTGYTLLPIMDDIDEALALLDSAEPSGDVQPPADVVERLITAYNAVSPENLMDDQLEIEAWQELSDAIDAITAMPQPTHTMEEVIDIIRKCPECEKAHSDYLDNRVAAKEMFIAAIKTLSRAGVLKGVG